MSGYSRRKVDTRRQRNTIIVVCEGDTEVSYLDSFKSRYGGLRIVPTQGKCTDPKGIVEYAIDLWNKNKKALNYDDGDRVWCVFDVDSNSATALKKAFENAAKENIGISLSNPCIELWFLLHTDPSQNAALSKDDAFHEVVRRIPGYEKGKSIAKKIKADEPKAIKRAKSLDKQHERDGYCENTRDCNPSSRMYVLIEYIYKIQKRNEKR